MLLGLGIGAMYAALAVGVIIVHRGTGVVNFALGAQAMFPAIVYVELRTSGDLLLPVVLLPNRIALGEAVGFWPAAVVALTIGMLVSIVAYLVIFRPLRQAPALNVIVATIGLTIVLQGLAVKSFGTTTVRGPSILPRNSISVFDNRVPVDRFWLTGLVVVLMIILTVVYRRTRFGLATRAAAGNEKGTILLGFDPVRLGVINWVLASLLASTIGILTTSLSGVNPFNYSLFVIPALGAALAARLRSFGVAVFTGLAIGAFQAVAVRLVSQEMVPTVLRGGLDSLIPFVVIVVALLRSGRTLPDRATLVPRYHVTVTRQAMDPKLWLSVVLVGVAIALLADSSVRLGLIQSMFVTTLLLSIVLMTGIVGQVSLAQLAFAGCSAFLLAEATTDWNLPFPLGPIAAVALTTIIGTIIAAPALRIRGLQFAIVTFAAALVFERLMFRSPTFTGESGVALVETPQLFGIDLGIFAGGTFPSRRFTVISVLVAAAAALFVARIRNSSLGRRLLAVRNNERAAAAAGISVPFHKLLGAALASFVAAVAGVISAYKVTQLTSASYEPDAGLELLGLAFLGGIGSVTGAVIGGLIAPSGLLIVWLSSAAPSENLFLVTGIGLILVTLRFPAGIAGTLELVAQRLFGRFRSNEAHDRRR